jgi:hypothetical protein
MKHSIPHPRSGIVRTLTLLVFAWICGGPIANGQDSAFTYQGRLDDGAGPATGIYDLRFAIYDLADAGTSVAGPVTNSAVAVTNGLFTTTLDFGAGVFNGAERWLEIGVRAYEGGAFTILSPRQPIAATPYAIRAANFSGPVAASQLTGTISTNNIGAGTITSTMLAAGAVGSGQLAAGAVTSAALADGAVTADKMVTVFDSFALTITNPVPGSGNLFGRAVAGVGDDRLVVGGSGRAYLFDLGGTALTNFPNPLPSGNFGSAVAALGSDRVVVGSPSTVGAAFLFGVNGTLLTTFTNPAPVGDTQFGFPVAAVGTDRVLIGAHQDDTGGANAGAAFLFSTNGMLLTAFTNPTPAAGDIFGVSVAGVGSDLVLIGAQGDDTAGLDAGAAYLFHAGGALLATVTHPVPHLVGLFGGRVAAVGNDRLLISEGFGGARGGGAAYLFRTDGTLLTTFTNPAPAANDGFGSSVAAVGNDRVIIGAAQDDTGATNSGSAYLFSTNGAFLAAFNNPTPAEQDSYGFAVTGVGSGHVAIGAFTDDTVGGNAGAVYLFPLETFTPGLVAERVRASSITTGELDATVGVWTRAGDNVYRAAGNVGIGTTTPQSALHVAGDAAFFDNPGGAIRVASTAGQLNNNDLGIWNRGGSGGQPFAIADWNTGTRGIFVNTASGNVGIGTAVPGFLLHVNGSAGKPGGGTWSVASDARLKKNIRPLAGALDKLLALHGVNFEYIDPAKAHELSGERMGLVAQEVEKVFPDWVETGADGYKRVTVRGLEALVVEALRELQQELNRKVEAQRAELKQKETEVTELKRGMEQLKTQMNALARKLDGGAR